MHRALRWAGPFAVLAALAAARADDPKPKGDPPKNDEAAQKEQTPKTPAEQLQALVKEFSDARTEFLKIYREAKTDEEREKLVKEKYPAPKYAGRFLKLAQEHPDDPTALDALAWVVRNVGGGPDRQKALDLLVKDHLKSEKLADVCTALEGPEGETALRAILEKSPHRRVQGVACFSLAESLKERAGGGAADADTLNKEAEALFERVEKEFADVEMSAGRKLGDLAKGELFEIRNLAVGKKAPEIEAEDIEGTKFKLSDYKGKVILLDFWGHW